MPGSLIGNTGSVSKRFQVRNRYDQTGTPQKDKIITPLIDQGPVSLPDRCKPSGIESFPSAAFYNYLDMGLLTARNVDLKRKVKFKPRKSP